jgi:hypothetical protein
MTGCKRKVAASTLRHAAQAVGVVDLSFKLAENSRRVGFCAAYDESRDRILVMTRDVSNADR